MTPDNAGQTTSELLEELGAASKNYPDGVRADHEDEDIAAIHCARLASDELEMIAEDFLPPVVAALEEAPCIWTDPAGRCKTRTDNPDAWCPRCKALADLRKAITEALAATKEAQE